MASSLNLKSENDLRREYPPFITVDELAELLRLNRKSLYAAISRGKIPGVIRIGGSIRISRDTVIDWLLGKSR